MFDYKLLFFTYYYLLLVKKFDDIDNESERQDINIDEKLSALSNGTIITTLNLSNGYLQIPLSHEAKIKTAFITPDETAQFERIPFGLEAAPEKFWKLFS